MDYCGNEWGKPWGSYFPPCDPVDPVQTALGRARQRMIEDPVFRALVRLLGEVIGDVEDDAWQLLHRIGPGVATGVLLNQWGEDLGLPKPSLLWDSTRYRKVLGAWLPAQMGDRSIPKLLRLMDALVDGETYTVGEYFPSKAVIDVVGIDADRASIWAQILEAARPKTVQFWLTYNGGDATPFIIGESEIDGPDVIGGVIILGG